jgi:hypothetical protein
LKACFRALHGEDRHARSAVNCASALVAACHRRVSLKPEEIRKLDAYFKRTFNNPSLEVKARPRKDDSCELYLGDEFLGIIFKDDDDGELSYNFSMAILDVDL